MWSTQGLSKPDSKQSRHLGAIMVFITHRFWMEKIYQMQKRSSQYSWATGILPSCRECILMQTKVFRSVYNGSWIEMGALCFVRSAPSQVPPITFQVPRTLIGLHAPPGTFPCGGLPIAGRAPSSLSRLCAQLTTLSEVGGRISAQLMSGQLGTEAGRVGRAPPVTGVPPQGMVPGSTQSPISGPLGRVIGCICNGGALCFKPSPLCPIMKQELGCNSETVNLRDCSSYVF